MLQWIRNKLRARRERNEPGHTAYAGRTAMRTADADGRRRADGDDGTSNLLLGIAIANAYANTSVTPTEPAHDSSSSSNSGSGGSSNSCGGGGSSCGGTSGGGDT